MEHFFVPTLKPVRWNEGFIDENGSQQLPIKIFKTNIDSNVKQNCVQCN
jgi:hypothetical protein